MGLMSPELSLDLKPSCVPETINGFLREVLMIGDVTERLKKVDEFVKKLEEEMKKIQVFKRELPLCMLLLKDAIVALKQESTQYRTRNAYQPVLEEFIPVRKDTDGENTQKNEIKMKKTDEEDSTRDKKNWMSSVQLWSSDSSPTSTAQNLNQNQSHILVAESQKADDKRNKSLSDELIYPGKKVAGCTGFMPMIHTYPNFSELGRKIDNEEGGAVGLSLITPGITPPKQDLASCGFSSKFLARGISSSSSPSSNVQLNVRSVHQQAAARKQRRCWSPDLHRKFVDALTQLGGPQVATPKQIRELMHIDGLTNDEVKSHLQKYRLHTRKTGPNTSPNSVNENGNSFANSWAAQDQCSDSSKPNSSQSGSPLGPHQFPEGASTTGCDSMEDAEDDKSESHSWNDV